MTSIQKTALLYVRLVRLARLTVINLFSKLLFRNNNDCNKILLNRDGAFGDSIVALPAINIVRQNNPSAQIDLLSINNNGVSFNDIGLDTKLINNLYIINKKQRHETLKILKKEKYDLFIQIPQNIGIYKSLRNMFLVRFYLNIKNAFGWDSGRVKSFMRLQKENSEIPTETNRFIHVLHKHHFEGTKKYGILNRSPEDIKLVEFINKTPPVAFLIGGKLQPKKWPLYHWVALAKMIGDEQRILIIGGEGEKGDAAYIVSNTLNTINYCGQLSIPELYYVLSKTKVAISLDTGAMHLCDAAGTRQIVLFSTRDLSNKWYPNNPLSAVIEKVVHCSFCLKTECSNNICMSNISPEEVYNKMNELLST